MPRVFYSPEYVAAGYSFETTRKAVITQEVLSSRCIDLHCLQRRKGDKASPSSPPRRISSRRLLFARAATAWTTLR